MDVKVSKIKENMVKWECSKRSFFRGFMKKKENLMATKTDFESMMKKLQENTTIGQSWIINIPMRINGNRSLVDSIRQPGNR